MQAIALDGNHWTVRWYRYYVSLGGFGRDPENLCRFLRVVTVWAPIRWLLWPHQKDGPPFILILALGLSFLTLVGVFIIGISFGIHDAAVKASAIYAAQGIPGLIPSRSDLRVTGYLFGSAALLTVAAVVWSGLYRLYRERYKYARDGKLCPFMAVEGGPLLPAGVVVKVAAEDDESDPLLLAAKSAEAFLSEEYATKALVPNCLFTLRAAIAEEESND